jgi:Mn-dependent DtxR family transcriptional regulator
METVAVKVLKILAEHGPLDISSIRRLLNIKHTRTVSSAVRKLERYGLVECSWVCKLTEKGKIALQHADECLDIFNCPPEP